MRLQTQDRNIFEASAEIAKAHSGQFRTGDSVAIRLSGLALTMPMVQGVISDLQDAPGMAAQQRMTQVTVQIDPEQIKDPFLRDAVTHQLTSSNGRSTISLSWDGVNLLERLRRSANAMVVDHSGALILSLIHLAKNV